MTTNSGIPAERRLAAHWELWQSKLHQAAPAGSPPESLASPPAAGCNVIERACAPKEAAKETWKSFKVHWKQETHRRVRARNNSKCACAVGRPAGEASTMCAGFQALLPESPSCKEQNEELAA